MSVTKFESSCESVVSPIFSCKGHSFLLVALYHNIPDAMEGVMSMSLGVGSAVSKAPCLHILTN